MPTEHETNRGGRGDKKGHLNKKSARKNQGPGSTVRASLSITQRKPTEGKQGESPRTVGSGGNH